MTQHVLGFEPYNYMRPYVQINIPKFG